jgi:hypothetical protein
VPRARVHPPGKATCSAPLASGKEGHLSVRKDDDGRNPAPKISHHGNACPCPCPASRVLVAQQLGNCTTTVRSERRLRSCPPVDWAREDGKIPSDLWSLGTDQARPSASGDGYKNSTVYFLSVSLGLSLVASSLARQCFFGVRNQAKIRAA